jgi:phosphatidate cytidylyltransferase
MNDLAFWGLVALGLMGLLAVRWLLKPAGNTIGRRPSSKLVIDFISDRERNGWLFLFCFWSAVVIHPGIALFLFGMQSFLGLREFMTRSPANDADYKALFAAFFVLLPLQYIFIGLGWVGIFSVLIPVYAFFLLPTLSAISGNTKDYFARAAKLQLGVMLCVYGLSHIPATTLLVNTVGTIHAAYMMLFLVLVNQVSEIVQFAVSRRYGKRRLARNITRNLTVEGLVAGVISAVAVGLAMYWAVPFNWNTNIGVSICIFAAGVLGNLVLGSIRKSTGIRDWGEAIAGRSSVLDRIGSLSFAAPLYFQLARAILEN